MVHIAPAKPDDVEDLAALMEEMDRFYGDDVTEPRDARVDQIHDNLFGELPAGFVLLAWDEDDLAGFAAYSFLWPAEGVTRSLYLKELYVADSHRRTGVGGSLFDAVVATAQRHRCSRVEWTTDTSNIAAQEFYRRLGVEPNEGKIIYRLDGQHLDRAS